MKGLEVVSDGGSRKELFYETKELYVKINKMNIFNYCRRNTYEQLNKAVNFDPVPLDIDWSPLNRSGNFFRTRKAKLFEGNKVIFIPTIRAVLAYSLFLFIGLKVIFSLFSLNANNTSFKQFLAEIIFGTAFTLFGMIANWLVIRPAVFDKTRNMFYRGWRIPKANLSNKKEAVSLQNRYIPLDKVYSLQLLSFLPQGGSGNRRYGYQLNLILKNTERIFIVGHADIKQIRRDAKLLSGFLNIPIWEELYLNKKHLF